jgi:hypothetical protein
LQVQQSILFNKEKYKVGKKNVFFLTKSSMDCFSLGWISGVAGIIVGSPLDVLKVMNMNKMM